MYAIVSKFQFAKIGVKYSSDLGPSIISRGLLAASAPTAGAGLDRCQPVRHPRFPSNPPTQSGPRAEKISGKYIYPFPAPQVVQARTESGGAGG